MSKSSLCNVILLDFNFAVLISMQSTVTHQLEKRLLLGVPRKRFSCAVEASLNKNITLIL